MRHRSARIFAWVAVAFFACAGVLPAADVHLYVGTYTRGTDSKGIYVYQFDDATGADLAAVKALSRPALASSQLVRRRLFPDADRRRDHAGGTAQGSLRFLRD